VSTGSDTNFCLSFDGFDRFVINSAKGIPLVAADYIIKQIVTIKVRVFLFLLLSLFVPTIWEFVKAVTPFFDWNDTHTTRWRRPYNQFIPCYYMAFPPFVDPVTHETLPVLLCDSLYGVAIHCGASTALAIVMLGMPLLIYYLGEETFKSLRKTDWYDNFEFFNLSYRQQLEKLSEWPQHRVMMEQGRQTFHTLHEKWVEKVHAMMGRYKSCKLPSWMAKRRRPKKRRKTRLRKSLISKMSGTTSLADTFRSTFRSTKTGDDIFAEDEALIQETKSSCGPCRQCKVGLGLGTRDTSALEWLLTHPTGISSYLSAGPQIPRH